MYYPPVAKNSTFQNNTAVKGSGGALFSENGVNIPNAGGLPCVQYTNSY